LVQGFEEVPGNRLALTVRVSGEIELVGVLEQTLELGDLALLFRGDDVERLEIVVDVDTEPRPWLTLVLGRHVGRAARQVTNVTDRGLHHVVAAQVRRDLLRLRRRLDDDKTAWFGSAGGVPRAVLPCCHLAAEPSVVTFPGCHCFLDAACASTPRAVAASYPPEPTFLPVRLVTEWHTSSK
jgi:hypothetical protein